MISTVHHYFENFLQGALRIVGVEHLHEGGSCLMTDELFLSCVLVIEAGAPAQQPTQIDVDISRVVFPDLTKLKLCQFPSQRITWITRLVTFTQHLLFLLFSQRINLCF